MHGSAPPSGGALADLANVAQDEFELYPENVPAVRLFERVRGCWRVVAGVNGIKYLGLDWAQVHAKLEMSATDRGQWPALLADMEVIEIAALDEIRATQQRKR